MQGRAYEQVAKQKGNLKWEKRDLPEEVIFRKSDDCRVGKELLCSKQKDQYLRSKDNLLDTLKSLGCGWPSENQFVIASIIKYMSNERVERKETREARGNDILRGLVCHAKEFALHLSNYGEWSTEKNGIVYAVGNVTNFVF